MKDWRRRAGTRESGRRLGAVLLHVEGAGINCDEELVLFEHRSDRLHVAAPGAQVVTITVKRIGP